MQFGRAIIGCNCDNRWWIIINDYMDQIIKTEMMQIQILQINLKKKSNTKNTKNKKKIFFRIDECCSFFFD